MRCVLLVLVVLAGGIGCGSEPAVDARGQGGQASEGGHDAAGGSAPEPPICDCAIGGPLECGAALADAAAESGCLLPLLPKHADDLLSCTDGSWQLEQACEAGCAPGPPDACISALPVVTMDELVLQAQVEPFRGDQPTLPGDPSVELVQWALGEEGFTVTVDGWFGNETADSYASWQALLGYSGLGANGIPGPSSLETLGVDRFAIDHPIHLGAQTTHSGKAINQRTKDMIVAAEGIVGYDIVVTQGSYNAGGVSASAGTHDGGGAVDISVLNKTTTERWELVKALRTVGFAAWLRTPSQGNWPYHIHAIAIGDTDVSISARNQIADYFVGLNGLASHAPDNTPPEYQVPFAWWESFRGR